MRSQIEMSALTFFSCATISTEGWSFLVVEGVALAGVSAVVGPNSWPTVGGWLAGEGWLVGGVGSGRLGLAAGVVGL